MIAHSTSPDPSPFSVGSGDGSPFPSESHREFARLYRALQLRPAVIRAELGLSRSTVDGLLLVADGKARARPTNGRKPPSPRVLAKLRELHARSLQASAMVLAQ